MIRKTILAAAVAVVTAAGFIAPAAAEDRFTISWRDLNLNNSADAHTLVERVERVADQSCGVNQGRTSIAVRRQALACKNQMMAETIAKIDAPLVQVAYAERFGSPTITVARN